jgi:hypothetical protein
MITTDPIVTEMRKAGEKLQKECRDDLHLFSQMITKGTEKRKKDGWHVLTKRDLKNRRFSHVK